MALLITRNGTDWVQSGEFGASGPCWGFDTDLGRPVFRTPDGLVWVDAAGAVVSLEVNLLAFPIPTNSGLLAVL